MGLLEQAYKSQGKTYTPTATSSGGLLQQAQASISSKPTKSTLIKISPTATKVPIAQLQQPKATGLLGKAQQTMTGVAQKVGGAIGKLASFLPEKNAPIKITPNQKKVDLKLLGGGDTKVNNSATVTQQVKEQTTQKFKQIREGFRTKSVEQVKRPIKPGYKEPGVLGSMVEALKEGSVSLVSNMGASTEMVGNMTNMMLLTVAGRKIQKEADKVLATNPEWAADPMEKWGTKKVVRLVVGAAPSLLAVIAATMVAGPAGATLAGFGMEAGPTYKESKEAGTTERQAQVYGTVVGTVNGVLERIFPAELLKGVGKKTVKEVGKSLVKDITEQAGKYGVKFLKSGALEGSTEALQEMWSNVIANNYDKNRQVWDNLLESFVGGFGSGGVAGAVEQSTRIRETLPPGENDPQTVINEVLKQKAENTEEGKALIKEAVVAQQTGEKIVIEKPVEEVQPQVEVKTEGKVIPKEEKITRESTIGVSKLAEGVKRKAMKNRIIYGFDKTFNNLPEYDKVNVKEQGERSSEYVLSNPEEAFQVAMGRKAPPNGMLPESVFVAVENYAIETKNVNVLRELATNSELTTTATTMGQRIRMLAERNPDSALSRMTEVSKVREEEGKKKYKDLNKVRKNGVENAKKEVKPVNKYDWNAFLETISC